MACSPGQSARLTAAFVIVFLAAYLIAVGVIRASANRSISACFLTSCAGSPGPQPGQDIYTARLRQDEQSLDRGVLTYSPIGTIKTTVTTQFEVVVTDVGRGLQRVSLTKSNGMAVCQQDVPTKGVIGAQIVGGENLTWRQQSSSRQLVLERGDSATWVWEVTAGAPGPAKLMLRLDTYDRGSGQTLHEEMLRVDGEVVPSAAYKHQERLKKISSIVKSAVGDIVAVGSVATAILAVGGVAGWIAANKRNLGKNGKSGTGRRGQLTHSRRRIRQVSGIRGGLGRAAGRDAPVDRWARPWITGRK
jgi:hypothetical protein